MRIGKKIPHGDGGNALLELRIRGYVVCCDCHLRINLCI